MTKQITPKAEVRTRIAPSPTGEDLHIGNVYTALLNFVYAKKNKGQFIVRIEDTDRTRLVEGSEQRILDSLKWLGLFYDEGPDKKGPYQPYRQSERKETYKKYAEELVQKGHAFYCFCTQQRLEEMRKKQQVAKQPTLYDGFCKKYSLEEARKKVETEKYVIRLNVPNEGVTEFIDLLRGKISFENKLLDDQVLLKSDGYPTYHLGVVVDDYLMKISHIIRAEEWISSTPKHVLLYTFFGWELPVFVHGPILRNPDKSKLSKRKNPVWVSWYRKQGFLPEAIVNYLALMGWAMPNGREIFTLEEMMKEFKLEDLKPVAPVFDLTKLEWMNGEYIRKLRLKDLREKLLEFYKNDSEMQTVLTEESAHKDILLGLAQTRMRTLKDFKILLSQKETTVTYSEEEKKIGKRLFTLLKNETTPWNKDELLALLKNFSKNEQVSMKIIYKVLTGKEKGLPLIDMMVVYGKDHYTQHLRSF